MLRSPLHALLIFVLAGHALAQDPPAAPKPADAAKPEASARVSLVQKPSLKAVQDAFVASGLEKVDAILAFDYDAQGMIVHAVLDKTSGNEALDRAILDWGKQARVTPGSAGKGRAPFHLVKGESEEVDAAYRQLMAEVPEIDMQRMVARKPSLEPVQRAMARSDVSRADAEIVLWYDAKGDVTRAWFLKRSGIDAVDQAIMEWSKELKLNPGVGGMVRLPFQLETR